MTDGVAAASTVLPVGQVAWPLVLAPLVLALVVGTVVWSFIADRRAREALFAWAAQQGWTWEADRDDLVHLLADEPFGRGHSRRVRHVVRGPWGGREVVALDYRYKITSGSGKNRRTRTYDHGVVAVRLPAPLPRVHVGPENVFHKIAQAVGFDDIEVESHEFNRRYRVEATDRKAAFDLLHPRLVEQLAQAEAVEWRTDLSTIGPVLVAWWPGRLDPDAIARRLVVLNAVVGSVPGYVWRDAGWDPDTQRPVGA